VRVSVTPDDYRQCMSRWASGVTIVTSRAGDTIHGMTVSDFSGVSLDPPLVCVCADKSSNTLGVIRDGGCFAVNVLAAGQQALSNKFASKKDEFKRFEGLDFREGPSGAPLIGGCVSNIDCKLVAEHDAGDHVIFVGEVQQITSSELDPLLYFSGSYGRFSTAD
jgi:flavin reductase (DIM6/NTAB) family NADH-FMN oxidoreductase RutF